MIESSVPIRSVIRSLTVLRTINAFGSISMSELARQANLPYPTTFRIMQTLIHEGMIEREGVSKRYRPTPLVQSLANGLGSRGVRCDPHPLMSAITRETGWPVCIAERTGRRLVIRASTHHETTLTFFNWRNGSNFPILGSVSGLAWLAYQADHCAQNLFLGELDFDVQNDLFDMDELYRALEKVRECGYAWRPSIYEKNGKTASLAVPVFTGGQVESVLTLTYFASAMKGEVAIARYLDIMRDAAAGIASTL